MRTAKFVESYFDAWNHSDAKGVAEHLVKNGTYCDIPSNERHSREALVGNLVDFFEREHRHYQLIGEVLANDETIAFQYKISSLDSTADDRLGAEFMTVDGDGALNIADYYDPIQSGSLAPSISRKPNAQKYAKSGLSDKQMGEYTERLRALMEHEKVYLESDLTMLKLASLVDCSVNHLSQVVNSGFGMSFFDCLNNYRIEEAKTMLGHSNPQQQAILDVSFAVGFNSNSAFYAAFKKATGQTPAQYRRLSLV
ncbi:MAG: helix-turn-helix domain-containing protein [Pseudomonadales bacterium]